MSQDWPSPHRAQRDPLPTTDGLPHAGDGYDRESVDEAFAAFYRHIAQLDTTLRTLESVESFRQQAAELRADLRSMRAAGWTPYPRGYPALPADGMSLGLALALPEALPRLALEVAFLIAVAVIAAVGGFGAAWIVVVMAVAVALTAAFEWLMTHGGRPAALPAPAPPVLAPAVAAPVVVDAVPAVDGAGWAAFADAPVVEAAAVMEAVAGGEPEDTEPDASLEPEPQAAALEPAPPELEEPEVEEPAVPEPEPEQPEQAEGAEPVGEATAEIEATDVDEPGFARDLAPWERGFDDTLAGGKEDEAPLPR